MLLILAIYVLAVARLTRLINADTILDPFRVWIAERMRHHRLVATELRAHLSKDNAYQHHQTVMRRWTTLFGFVQCPWCVGMWLALAGAVVPVRLLHWPWWAIVPVGLACSHLVGIGARLADTEEIDIEDDEAQ